MIYVFSQQRCYVKNQFFTLKLLNQTDGTIWANNDVWTKYRYKTVMFNRINVLESYFYNFYIRWNIQPRQKKTFPITNIISGEHSLIQKYSSKLRFFGLGKVSFW